MLTLIHPSINRGPRDGPKHIRPRRAVLGNEEKRGDPGKRMSLGLMMVNQKGQKAQANNPPANGPTVQPHGEGKQNGT